MRKNNFLTIRFTQILSIKLCLWPDGALRCLSGELLSPQIFMEGPLEGARATPIINQSFFASNYLALVVIKVHNDAARSVEKAHR